VSAVVGLPPIQTQPASTDEQSEAQPSTVAAVFPSSHFSVPASSPSPHFVTHVSGFAALS